MIFCLIILTKPVGLTLLTGFVDKRMYALASKG